MKWFQTKQKVIVPQLVTALLCLVPLFFASSLKAEKAAELNELAYDSLKAGQFDNLFKYASEAEKAALKEQDHHELARAISNKASSYYYLGQNEQALALYSESLAIAEKNSDSEGIYRALNNIASIYNHNQDYQQALTYHLRLYNTIKNSGSNDQILSSLISISQSYAYLKNLSNARLYSDKAKTFLNQHNNVFFKVYELLAEADIKILEGSHQSAIDTLKSATKIAEKNDFKGLIITAKANIADIFFDSGDLARAKEISLEILKRSQEQNLKTKELQSHELLAKIFEAEKNYKLANLHMKNSRELEEIIRGNRVRQLASITKIDRELLETQKALERSENSKKIAELKLESQTQIQIIWSALVLILFSSSFFWYYRKTSKQEIERQKAVNEELKRLDKVKDRILTNTSHELRTPLNGIIGLSQVLIIENEDKLEQESLDHLKLIEKSGNQLSEIVDDILDLAKLRTHYVNFKPSEFSISPLINEVILTCRPLLKNKAVEMSIDESSEDCQLFQDRTRLKQVLFNLIGNAAKFTPEGSISVKAKSISDKLEIVVKDTGIGIPENMQDRVFEGFEQVDASDSRENGGSGLGLAICKEIVEGLGGKIKLESQLGKGTGVSVTIPTKLTRSSQ